MKEFIDKLIERLEEYKRKHRGSDFHYHIASNDIIEIVNQLAEEHKDNVMIDGQYCWQTCGAIEHCKDCNRLCNGSIDYYENYDVLAEEHNVGWIPCSERLPEEKEQEGTVYDPITLAEVDIERYMASDLVNVTVRSWDSDEVFVCDDCTVDGKWVNFNGEQYEVIAWQPLPAPYTEGE